MEAPRIKMDMVAEKEITAYQHGRQSKRRVPTTTIEPGGHLFYTVRLTNEGKGPAHNVVVDNPVPKGAVYVPGSARGRGSTMSVSIDGGESWMVEAPDLFGEVVTHLRWRIDVLAPGEKRRLEFEVLAMSAEATALARFWAGLYAWLRSAILR